MKTNESIRVVVFLLSFLILLMPAMNLSAADVDWIIEPGVRVGPITSNTTEEDLKKIYGAANVVEYDGQAGEVKWKGTVVFPNDPTKTIVIDWLKKDPNRNPRSMQLEGNRSKWATREGITVGTSLEDIVRLNGQPVALSNDGASWGFDGRYVSDVMGGNLKGLVSQGLFIKLQPAGQLLSWVVKPQYMKLRGENKILSNHPFVEKAKYSVRRIEILFEKPEII